MSTRHQTTLRYYDGSFIDVYVEDHRYTDLGNTYNLACMMGHEDIVDAYWAEELPSVAEAHDCSIDGVELTVVSYYPHKLAQLCAFVSMTLGLRVKDKLEKNQ